MRLAEQEELAQFEKQETGFVRSSAVFASKAASALRPARQEARLALCRSAADGVAAAAAGTLTSADLGNRGAVSYVDVEGKVFVPEGEADVSLKRPNPWAHSDNSIKVRDPASWTIIRHDGPDHLGL